MMWHVGAIMTCVGGYWFWLFLRVDVLQKHTLGIELLKLIYLF